MIERMIQNELTLKRYRRFKSDRLAVASFYLLLLACVFSFTAEFWSNSKPLLLEYHGSFYFPVFKDYNPIDFGRTDIYEMDYKALKLDQTDWAVWPIFRWDPYESNRAVQSYPAPPSKVNPMGTDDRGRDVLSRLLYGLRYSITFAVVVWFLAFLAGTAAGAIMGYMGGPVDLVGQRVVEVMETIPTLPLLIIIISVFSPNMWLLILFNVVFGWMFICVYVRAEFLKWRKREFVEAAKALGLSRRRIIFKHILPNALGPVITFSPFIISSNIVGLSVLDYLGFGLRPPTPSWGELLGQAKNYFSIAWWLAIYPTLALFITLVLLNLIGQSVRDAFDPRKV